MVIADVSEDYKDIGKAIEIVNIDGQKLLAGLHTYIARDKEKLALGFKGYLMQTSRVRSQIMQMATGISVLGISKGNLLKLELKLPVFEEQQKIADFLTAIDDKIQQLTRKKSLLEQYKKGVMQQIFSQQIRFKDDNGEGYPKWEEKTLGKIAKKVNTKNKGSKVTFVLTNSATQGVVSQKDYFDKDIANQNNLEGYYIVDIDDFVYNPRISTSAPVGPIKRNKLAKGVMSPLYTAFRFNSGNLVYLEYYFETSFWHEYLKGVANSGARHDRMNITTESFFNMPIPLPDSAEQQKIASFLSSIDNKIESVTKQIESTQAYKKGLLQQLFV